MIKFSPELPLFCEEPLTLKYKPWAFFPHFVSLFFPLQSPTIPFICISNFTEGGDYSADAISLLPTVFVLSAKFTTKIHW